MTSKESFENIPLTQMIASLKARTSAFQKQFASMKEEYDELSEQRSDIIQSLSEQTEELKDHTKQYQDAMNDYKQAEADKLDAELELHLSLNTPADLVYSPQNTGLPLPSRISPEFSELREHSIFGIYDVLSIRLQNT